MRDVISERLRPFGTNIFTTYAVLAQRHGAVNLSQGFPDFDGPDFVKEAAARALVEQPNQYAPMPGILPLRAEIAARHTRATGLACDPATEVTVTCGCSEALPACVFGLTDTGDEVVLFEPFFDIHRSAIVMSTARPRAVRLRPPRATGGRGGAWTFDADELRRAFNGRTRAILVNTPHNPTGKVFTREELSLIAELCVRHDVVAITDEVYERLTYDAALPHLRLAAFPGMAERTITLSSLGKTFSLTGWKIGWAIAPARLTAAVRAAHQFLTFSISPALQFGAAEALRREEEYVPGLVADLRARRDELQRALGQAGLPAFDSPSGYFLVADLSDSAAARGGGAVVDDRRFCEHLVEHVRVAALPLSAFYGEEDPPRGLARFAFCKRRETIAEGARRLGAAG